MSTENSLPPVLYKNILYVTDLSESGRKAFPHAASIAQHYNAHLTVFHVVENKELDGLLGYLNDSLWEDLSKRSLEEARELLISRKRDNVEIMNDIERHCEDAISDSEQLTYEIKVEMGERLDKILSEAHGGNYDLLVISKHGNRSSVSDALVGDTTRRVVRRSKIPVMVIPLDD